MIASFAELECACLPATQLGRLAALRCTEGVEIALHDRDLWVRWTPGDESLARSLLALPGCRLFGRHDGRWHTWQQSLPVFDVPEGLTFRQLWQVVFPMPVRPLPAQEFSPIPTMLSLVVDGQHRPTTAMQCSLNEVLDWASANPPCVLQRIQAVRKTNDLLMLGRALPWLESAERFWGRSVLVPLGCRPQPALSETDLRQALGVAETDLAILRPQRCEVIAKDRFTSLSHGALRCLQKAVNP